eukprot:CCRYP_011336-RA/>CCRYP_011336-RA protein AED:0.47 eAED:0.47 QI:138/1/0.5/1/0/0/2/0/31
MAGNTNIGGELTQTGNPSFLMQRHSLIFEPR